MKKLNNQWTEELTANQYRILVEQGKDIEFAGDFVFDEKKKVFVCSKCRAPFLPPGIKGIGRWGKPSFYDVFKEGKVLVKKDNHPGIKRSKVMCTKCGEIISYVFEDSYGKPT